MKLGWLQSIWPCWSSFSTTWTDFGPGSELLGTLDKIRRTCFEHLRLIHTIFTLSAYYHDPKHMQSDLSVAAMPSTLSYWLCSTVPQGLLYPNISSAQLFLPSSFGGRPLCCMAQSRSSSMLVRLPQSLRANTLLYLLISSSSTWKPPSLSLARVRSTSDL